MLCVSMCTAALLYKGWRRAVTVTSASCNLGHRIADLDSRLQRQDDDDVSEGLYRAEIVPFPAAHARC